MDTQQKNSNIISIGYLLNKTLKNSKGEDVGEIKDVAVDLNSNFISYIVVEFGGIFGLGKKWFAIPPQAITPSNTEADVLCLDVDKEKMKNAVGFEKDKWPDRANQTWLDGVYKHFGYAPYSV